MTIIDEQVQAVHAALGALVGADQATEHMPHLDAAHFLDDQGDVDHERVRGWVTAAGLGRRRGWGQGHDSGHPDQSGNDGASEAARRFGSTSTVVPELLQSAEAIRRYSTTADRISVRPPSSRRFGQAGRSEAARRFAKESA